MRASGSQTTRRSVVAGRWYPGTYNGLTRTVDDYLAQVEQLPVSGDILGLVSPHAGYAYSGQTAAYAYHQLQGQRVDTVVLIGPSHHAWVGDYAVSAEDVYETPLGHVPLDRVLIGGLTRRVGVRRVEGDHEHSLEIQLPFLQRQLGSFRLVPIMMSSEDPATAQRLASALVDVIRQSTGEGKRTLLVASSDLHHIENYQEVVRRDRLVVDAIAAYDLERLTSLLMAPGCSVCGRMPVLTVLDAAKTLGADAVRVLHHTNSGDVTGDRRPGQYTVGYMAAAAYKSHPDQAQVS
ncbi:MAG TPA: AmmeMemoRadiSam system protein B [Anaerolineae bacterium]|nr:AmmeMemoRadiSam system protein B [Anaerolineae bacterium]